MPPGLARERVECLRGVAWSVTAHTLAATAPAPAPPGAVMPRSRLA